MRLAPARGAMPVWAVVAAVAGFWAWFHAAPPRTVFLASNPDPEVPYFLTSLAVFKGQPYAFVEHPGAPLALAGTAVLAPARPLFAGPEAFALAVLRHAGVFMLAVHALLLAGTVACLLRLGALLRPRGPRAGIEAAAVAASFFAVLPSAFTWPAYWSHNSLAFPLGTLLLAQAWEASRRHGRLPTRTALAVGAGAGTLTATQVYFAVWIVGLAVLPLGLARLGRRPARAGLREAALVGAGALAAFAAWTAPLLPMYPKFVGFVAAVITHQGIYGTGSAGFSSLATWSANMARLAAAAPLLFAALGGAAAMLAWGLLTSRGSRAARRAMAASLAVEGALLLILLGKHPSVFYLPALAALLPPLLALAFTAWRGRRGRLVRLAVSLAVLAAFAGNLARDVTAHRRRLRFREAMEREVASRAAAHARETSTARPLLLWGPLLRDAGCYSLWMGEQYTGHAFGAEISALCPDEGLAWSNSIVLPRGRGADEPALLVTTESAPAMFPAFRALGAAELAGVRDPSGHRLAFYRVRVREGRLLPVAAGESGPSQGTIE